MLTLVLYGTKQTIKNDLKSSYGKIEAVELRLDLSPQLNPLDVCELFRKYSFKIIYTLRMTHQGGLFSGSFEERLKKLESFFLKKPDFIDIEYDTPQSHITLIKKKYPSIQIILSYHDFEKLSPHLTLIFHELKKKNSHIIKMAFKANSSLDALKMFTFARKLFLLGEPLIVIAMGEYGTFLRILTKLHSKFFCYCYLEKDVQKVGQISLKQLIDTYHYGKTSPSTSVLALIGSPVSQSISHITHNDLLEELGLDALYIKIDLVAEQLVDFFSLIDWSVFKGFSVTSPLKEEILSLKFKRSEKVIAIGSANTVYYDGKVVLENTDAYGALKAIEEVADTDAICALILGTGGAARALGFALNQKSIPLTFMGRNSLKTEQIAKDFKGKGVSFSSRSFEHSPFQLIAQTTTVGMKTEESLLACESLPSDLILFEMITRPRETAFVKFGKKHGCKIIYGERMFLYQACLQFYYFFSIDLEVAKRILEKGLKKIESF